MSKREAVPKHSLPPQKQILSYMGRFINCPYAPDTEGNRAFLLHRDFLCLHSLTEKGGVVMFSAALLLLCQSLFWQLHLERCAQGDLDARNVLVERNLRLVAHIIKKYYTQSEDQEDLISIGTIGLIKAVNTFRADKGIRLATYASRCIENEILMYFRARKKLQGEVSLSDTLDTDGDGSEFSIGDAIGKSDTMLEDLQEKDERILVRRLVAECLTGREADIICRRYGLQGHPPQTQRQVAQAYGISRSYVSRGA